jgi:hypothetical protein
MADTCQQFLPEFTLTFSFQRGWEKETDYAEVLEPGAARRCAVSAGASGCSRRWRIRLRYESIPNQGKQISRWRAEYSAAIVEDMADTCQQFLPEFTLTFSGASGCSRRWRIRLRYESIPNQGTLFCIWGRRWVKSRWRNKSAAGVPNTAPLLSKTWRIPVSNFYRNSPRRCAVSAGASGCSRRWRIRLRYESIPNQGTLFCIWRLQGEERETAIGLTKDKQGDSKVRIDGTDGHKAYR